MRKKNLLAAVLVNCVLLVTGRSICHAEKLFVGYAGLGADLSHVWIAKEAGLFEKYGLDVVPIYFSGGRPLMQALLAGNIQLAATGGITSVRSIVAGGELIIVAGYMNKIASSFFTAKEITRPEQLKGKAVAISGFGTSSHALTEIALKRLGLNPLKDVTIVQVGDQTARFAALQANAIQGTIIAPPLTLLARKNGFNLMLDLPKAAIPWLQQVIISSKAFLLNRPDVTRNFMKGFVEGLALWQTDRDKSTKLLAKFMRIDISKNADILTETYDYMRAVTERKPYPNGEAIKLQLDMIAETDPRAKKIRPDQVMDLKLLREIDESGFIDRLY